MGSTGTALTMPPCSMACGGRPRTSSCAPPLNCRMTAAVLRLTSRSEFNTLQTMMSLDQCRKGYRFSISGPHDGGLRMPDPPVPTGGCMKIMMNIMRSAVQKLRSGEQCITQSMRFCHGETASVAVLSRVQRLTISLLQYRARHAHRAPAKYCKEYPSSLSTIPG